MIKLIYSLCLVVALGACGDKKLTPDQANDQPLVVEENGKFQSRSTLTRDYFSPVRIVWQSYETETYLINYTS